MVANSRFQVFLVPNYRVFQITVIYIILTFRGISNVLNTICKKEYLLAILVYWPQDNISVKEFYLVEI